MMDIDQTTYTDLSIFNQSGENSSLFEKLDFSRTLGGRSELYQLFLNPFGNRVKITETQRIIALILRNEKAWPSSITNGTVMVMERYYETPVDDIPISNNIVSALSFKLLHSSDYSLTRYSLRHFADFIRGLQQTVRLVESDEAPPLLDAVIARVKKLIGQDLIQSLGQKPAAEIFSPTEVILFGNYVRYHFKNSALELIGLFGKLDAWYSMSVANTIHQLGVPEFIDDDHPFLDITSLRHLLLPAAVGYDVKMNPSENFLFLTGANMAGKSTFIKAVGCALFLAHLGMGVPAANMRLTLFDGIISNINVVDNLAKGESYFFNEVQRIKKTIQKINNEKKWLVLIDELFKGTNVQDAMKCSDSVIRGLIKIKSSLFILSTHLYEIGEDLKSFPNISFKFFETSVHGDQLTFSYQLKDGISNDRIGYLILKREKVVELLDHL